jgi:hypothetical protein
MLCLGKDFVKIDRASFFVRRCEFLKGNLQILFAGRETLVPSKVNPSLYHQ